MIINKFSTNDYTGSLCYPNFKRPGDHHYTWQPLKPLDSVDIHAAKFEKQFSQIPQDLLPKYIDKAIREVFPREDKIAGIYKAVAKIMR